MSLKVEWFDREYIAKAERAAGVGLDRAADTYRSEVIRELSKTTGRAVGKTQTGRNIYTASIPGTPPGARSGRLRNSITWRKSGPLSRKIGTNLVYARIHELGGTIQHPGGTAYMVVGWRNGGGAVFISNRKAPPGIRRTKPHPIPMPKRPYLVPTLERMAGSGKLQAVFSRGFRDAMGVGGGA